MLSTGCNEIIRGCFHEPQSKLLPDKPGSHVRCLCPFITHHTKNSLVLGLFVHVCVCVLVGCLTCLTYRNSPIMKITPWMFLNSWPNLCSACPGLPQAAALRRETQSPWKGQERRYEAALSPGHLWTPAILAASKSPACPCPSSCKWQWALTICEPFPTNWVISKDENKSESSEEFWCDTSSNVIDKCGELLDKCHNEECFQMMWTGYH